MSAQTYQYSASIEAFGMRVDGIDPNVNYDKNISLNSPTSFYFSMSFQFVDANFVSIRLGYLVADKEKYTGPELGIYYRRYLLTKKTYLLTGVNLHLNNSYESGVGKTKQKGITLIGLGFGINIDKYGFFELLFYQPLNNNFGFTYDEEFNPQIIRRNIYGMVKAGLAFRIDI
ncbi:MAG: hypothetical protein K9J16_07890 [Melioribacteraceae bacterium]|nr:hypothetical protein [Melioribacteraceae bacterium]MCF8353352.1 hypothetical protein [Melioribacteraceae bacterium]MCF8393216.1 hypothetical protein [Melioribacteraceae bacterium]MCF8419078.1 hypothetical protein [Melioribacteraceae bacterium]